MRRERILLLTSDMHAKSELVSALDHAGHEVLVAGDPRGGMRIAWEQRVGIVIIDLLSQSSYAIEVLKALKSEPASPKIIALGPEEMLVEIRRSLRKEHRPDVSVLAPWSITDVVERVRSLIAPLGSGARAAALAIDAGFAGPLVDLWRNSATGVLQVLAENVRTTVYFVNGEPVFAEHGRISDSLGRLLLREGLLTEHRLAAAIERMSEVLLASEDMRLGEVLIEMGLLAPVQVHDAIRQQVRAKILSCFQWRAIDYRFAERDDFLEQIGIFKCKVPPLLLEGIRGFYDPDRVGAILGPRLEHYPRLRDDIATVTQRFGLCGPEQRFLRSMTGTETIGVLRDSSNLDPEAAGQILTALVIMDQLELWSRPTTSDLIVAEGSQDLPRGGSQDLSRVPSDEGDAIVAEYLRMKGKSDEEVLRVPREAAPEQIHRAFAEGERRFGPEATRDLAPHFERKASEIFALLRAARDRMLSGRNNARATEFGKHAVVRPSANSPEAFAARQARLSAEKAYQKGKMLLMENSLVAALDEFKRARVAAPDVLEYRLLAKYAEYLVASSEVDRRTHRAHAKDLAEKVLAQDPRHAKAHAILGRFYRLDGDLANAEKHLRLAQSLDKRDRLPDAELRALARQAEEKGIKKKR